MDTFLRLNSGVGRGQDNREEDVAATDNSLREIGAYAPPSEYAGQPQRYATGPMVDALEGFQEQNGLKVDGYALPGGPTEQAINNNLIGKPRGAGLAQGFEMALGDSVGNGFANQPRDVQTVKRALGGLGYLPEDPFDRPSGFIDEATTNAVRGFQNDNRLMTDGWLGPGGETEAALRSAVERFARDNAPEWREYQRRTVAPTITRGPDNSDRSGEPPLSFWRSLLKEPIGLGSDARREQIVGAGRAVSDLRPTAARVQLASSMPEGIGDISLDPEANFGSWAIKRSDVLPEGVEPPDNPLKPDRLPRDSSGEMPRYDAEGRMLPLDVGTDSKREVRWLVSRLYRVGALDEEGRFRFGDSEFDSYLAAARDHIRPEHFPVFEMTARAVRAGALDWQTAATRLTAYFAPETTGESIADLLLDLTPVVSHIKGARDAHSALEDAIDAAAYGDARAHGAAVAKAALAIVGLIMPGAGAAAKRLAAKAIEKELHHLIPRYLSGIENGPLLPLFRAEHRAAAESLHQKMQAFFRNSRDFQHLAYGPKNSGLKITNDVPLKIRKQGLDQFYRSLKGSNVPYEREAYRAWRRIFPEADKYFKPLVLR